MLENARGSVRLARENTRASGGQPKAADGHCGSSAEDHQTAVDFGAARSISSGDKAYHVRKSRHREYGAHPESKQVRDRLNVGGEGQCYQYSKEMRAPRQSVQNANAKSSVRVMLVRLRFLVRHLMRMCVHVQVAFPIVFML